MAKQRQQRKTSKSKQVNPCNICGLPGEVQYKEMDKETGLIKMKTHLVPCLGHDLIRPHLWNRHPDYTNYRQLANLQHLTCGVDGNA